LSFSASTVQYLMGILVHPSESFRDDLCQDLDGNGTIGFNFKTYVLLYVQFEPLWRLMTVRVPKRTLC
jgi:hypothetical protein